MDTVQEFIKDISNTWTWGKLTEKEREAFSESLTGFARDGVITGDTETIGTICTVAYYMYIRGLGYTDFLGMWWRT